MKVFADILGIKDRNLAETSRLDWIDALRGLAMLLVIFGHLYKQRELFQFANAVKIPLFFAISGYLLYGRTQSTKTYFLSMLKRVVIPWLILSLGFGLRFILTQGFAFYANYAVEVLIGIRAWYMICCIIAQTLFFFLIKLLGDGWKLCISVIAITAVVLLFGTKRVNEPFQVTTALISQSFLLMGYLLKKYEYKLRDVKFWMALGLLGAYVALVILGMFLFPKCSMDIHMDAYYNIPYCFLLIVVGCVALFLCAQKIKRFPRWLLFIGQNTLVFFMHATFWTDLAREGLSLMKISLPKTWYGMLVLLTLCCIGCAFEAIILNKFFPEAAGKERKKIQKANNRFTKG